MTRKIEMCGYFVPSGNGGYCGIYDSRPEICKNYYCFDAKKRLASGNNSPCDNCIVAKMRDQGCCATNVGLGTKIISVNSIGDPLTDVNKVLEDTANIYLTEMLKQGKISSEEYDELLGI